MVERRRPIALVLECFASNRFLIRVHIDPIPRRIGPNHLFAVRFRSLLDSLLVSVILSMKNGNIYILDSLRR